MMSLRDRFGFSKADDAEPIGIGATWVPSAPVMEKPVDDASAADVVAKSLCAFWRGGPCPCELDPNRHCAAPSVFLKKATHIVWDLRRAGLLR